MAAGAQVMMSTPNFYRLEIAYSELPYYNAALTPALDVRNGFYHVSDAPGHGHTLNPDYIAAGPDKSLIDYPNAPFVQLRGRGSEATAGDARHVNTFCLTPELATNPI